MTDLESDLAIGGKLLAKVPLERLWAIKERADKIFSADIQGARYQALKIKIEIDDAIKEAQRIAEGKNHA